MCKLGKVKSSLFRKHSRMNSFVQPFYKWNQDDVVFQICYLAPHLLEFCLREQEGSNGAIVGFKIY